MIDEVFKTVTDDATGEGEVKRVSRQLGLPELEFLVDFRTKNTTSNFIKVLNILLTSTADCNGGFSDMNLTIIDLITSLAIKQPLIVRFDDHLHQWTASCRFQSTTLCEDLIVRSPFGSFSSKR